MSDEQSRADLRKLLKDTDEAILKYKRTLEFVKDQYTKVEFPLDDELYEEAKEIEEIISNLEFTKKIYSDTLDSRGTARFYPLSQFQKETTKSQEDIDSYELKKDHVDEILKGQKNITSNADKHHVASTKQSYKFLKIGLIGGGLIGFFASLAVGILLKQEIPTVIFANGTIIYP